MAQVLLNTDVLTEKSLCDLCALYLTNWSRLPGALKALIKQIDCILIILMWTMSFFLDDERGRNQISNFCHESPMTTNVVVNIHMNWNILFIAADTQSIYNILSQVILVINERVPTLALVGREYWLLSCRSQSTSKHSAGAYFLQRVCLPINRYDCSE